MQFRSADAANRVNREDSAPGVAQSTLIYKWCEALSDVKMSWVTSGGKMGFSNLGRKSDVHFNNFCNYSKN